MTTKNQAAAETIAFDTLRKARRFLRGYCVPRVIAKAAARRFVITTAATAKKHGWPIDQGRS